MATSDISVIAAWLCCEHHSCRALNLQTARPSVGRTL